MIVINDLDGCDDNDESDKDENGCDRVNPFKAVMMGKMTMRKMVRRKKNSEESNDEENLGFACSPSSGFPPQNQSSQDGQADIAKLLACNGVGNDNAEYDDDVGDDGGVEDTALAAGRS